MVVDERALRTRAPEPPLQHAPNPTPHADTNVVNFIEHVSYEEVGLGGKPREFSFDNLGSTTGQTPLNIGVHNEAGGI